MSEARKTNKDGVDATIFEATDCLNTIRALSTEIYEHNENKLEDALVYMHIQEVIRQTDRLYDLVLPKA